MMGFAPLGGAPLAADEDVAQPHALVATGIETGAPTVGSPALVEYHALTATGIVTGAPTVGSPELVDVAGSDDLIATGIDTGAPTVGTPALGEIYALVPVGIVTTPTVGRPEASRIEPPDVVAPPLPGASGGWRGGGESGTIAIYGAHDRHKPKTTRQLFNEAREEPAKHRETPFVPTVDRSEIARQMLAQSYAAALAAEEEDDDFLLMAA